MFTVQYPLLATLEREAIPSGRCPHCKRHTIFAHLCTIQPFPGDQPTFFKQGLKGGQLVLARCGHVECRSVVYRELHPDDEELEWDMYPPMDVDVDKQLPELLKKSFGEALSTFANGNWNSSAQASRRALQDTMRLLKPEDTKVESWPEKGLKRQINTLVQRQILMPQIGEWADEGRMIGVLGAHGPDTAEDWWAGEADANEALEFTKWVLRYVFVLPAQLKERRTRLASEVKETAPATE